MSKKDTVTKEYMQDKATFADAFNFYVYGGRQVIKPQNLRQLDPTELAFPYGKDGSLVPIQKYRDVLKIATVMRDDRAAYILLGIENQSHVHYAMPVKNMLYDAIQYVAQAEEMAKSHRQKGEKLKPGAEFLSGLRKTDKLIPVITLTIYFGPDKWDGPRDLHSMLDADEETLRFVDNYHLRLIVPSDISEQDFSKFVTELNVVLKYLKYSSDKREFVKKVGQDAAFQSVSKRTVDMLNAVADAKISYEAEEEQVNMCQAMQELIDNAKAEGEAKGVQIGVERGRLETLKENAASMRADGWDDETIARILRVGVADVKIWLDSEDN